MPPYLNENMEVYMSEKDILLKAVDEIQKKLPEGFQIVVDFFRVEELEAAFRAAIFNDDDHPSVISRFIESDKKGSHDYIQNKKNN